MSYYIHRPAVAQHFIRLGIRNGEYVVIRHCLKALAFCDCQLADDIIPGLELDRVWSACNDNAAILDMIDWIAGFCIVPVQLFEKGRGIQAGFSAKPPPLPQSVTAFPSGE